MEPEYVISYLDPHHPLIEETIRFVNQYNAVDYADFYSLDKYPNKLMIQLCNEFMRSVGYINLPIECCSGSNSLYEHHIYELDGEPEMSHFTRHHDDNGGITGLVNTIIIYYHIDSDLEGGYLIMYGSDDGKDGHIIDPRPQSNKICVICMRGDIEHEITVMGGYGERCCIVFQFPSERNGKIDDHLPE